MFKVSRRCSCIRAFQRTNSRGHTASKTFFITGNVPKMWFFMKSGRNFEVWQSILRKFYHAVWLQRPLKNFLEVKHMCSRYLEGAPASGLSNAPTPTVIRLVDQKILRNCDFFGKNTLIIYLFESHFASCWLKFIIQGDFLMPLTLNQAIFAYFLLIQLC